MPESIPSSDIQILPVDRVTPGDLLVSRPARANGAGPGERKTLVVAGVPVATVSGDPAHLTPLSTTSAEGMPVVEILAAIAAQHPTGLLILEERPPLERGFAFCLTGGKVVGARGPGRLDQLEAWLAELHRRFPERFEETDGRWPAWTKVARNFVSERVLDNLELAHQPGARMTFLRGDVQWVGTELSASNGPALEPLLLEHARRWDETPKIRQRLGDVKRVVVPLNPPLERPDKEAHAASSGAEWDFLDEPDDAALDEWHDAKIVYSRCDGHSCIEQVVEQAMLGRFRGLAALAALQSLRYVRLIDPPAISVPPVPEGIPEVAATGDENDAGIIMLPPTPNLAPKRVSPASDTQYSFVGNSARERIVERVTAPFGARRKANPSRQVRAPGAMISGPSRADELRRTPPARGADGPPSGREDARRASVPRNGTNPNHGLPRTDGREPRPSVPSRSEPSTPTDRPRGPSEGAAPPARQEDLREVGSRPTHGTAAPEPEVVRRIAGAPGSDRDPSTDGANTRLRRRVG